MYIPERESDFSLFSIQVPSETCRENLADLALLRSPILAQLVEHSTVVVF